MSDELNHERLRASNAHKHFFTHLATMPRWQLLVLILGLCMAVAGGVGWVITHKAPPETHTQVTQKTNNGGGSSMPANSSGFVNGSSNDASTTTTTTDTTTTADGPTSLIGRISPNATRIGGSVVAGFVLGWIFRAFLKTALFFVLLAGGALMALSYFGVLNIDLSAAKEHYASAVTWLTDQADKLKSTVIAHLPSTSGGAFGAFLGFRRR